MRWALAAAQAGVILLVSPFLIVATLGVVLASVVYAVALAVAGCFVDPPELSSFTERR